MDAKALYEVVKDVTREAWPDECYAHTYPEGDMSWGQREEPSQDQGITDAHAVLLFEASMIEFVVDRYDAIRIDDDGKFGFRVAPSGGDEFTGPTMIEALAAACKAVGGGE